MHIFKKYYVYYSSKIVDMFLNPNYLDNVGLISILKFDRFIHHNPLQLAVEKKLLYLMKGFFLINWFHA
jgi:hypothetical protein